jgi:lysophospholipase L1-like esterase
MRSSRTARRAAACAVVAAVFAWPSAAAARPAPGAWEAHNKRGAAATFVVERIHGRLVVDHYAQFCKGAQGIAGDGVLYTGGWPETNPSLRPSYSVNRLARNGRILPPRRPPFSHDPNPLRGRLRAFSGTIVGGMPQTESSEPIPHCGAHPRMKAAPVKTTRIRNGSWKLTGPYDTYGDVGVLGDGRLIGIGSYDFEGPENVPTGIPQFPFTSCGSINGSGGAYLPAEEAPGDTGAVMVSRTGTFAMADADPYDGNPVYPGGTLYIQGRFDSPTHATGTYRVTTISDHSCDSGVQPFQMTLAHGVEEPGADLPPAGPRPALRYAALGDSFSSGEGVRPYLHGTDVRNDRCHRSAHAYSRLFRFGARKPRLTFVACSGATTVNLWQAPPQYPGEHVVQVAAPGMSTATDLVTVTIGGNDVDFSSVLKACAKRRVLPGDCTQGRVAQRIDEQLTALPGKLANAYAAIRGAVGPHTAVMVLGYPQLFPDDRHYARCPRLTRAFYTRRVQRFLRTAGDKLQRVLVQWAGAARFQFVPVAATFDGHEVCTRDPWINPLRLRPSRLIKLRSPLDLGSFHPNAHGQAAYARALRSYIRHRVRAHAKLTPAGLPANP